MSRAEVTSEGWVVEDVKTFRLIADHLPPRPSVYRHQLCVDTTSWRPISFWVQGVGFIAVGLATGWSLSLLGAGWWLSLPVGALFCLVGVFYFLFWFWMFRRTVRMFRDSPTAVGVVEEVAFHPLLPDYSTAMVLTRDGQKVQVALPTQLVDDLLVAGRRAEVFFLHTPWVQVSIGLAARAVQDEPPAPADRPRD
jgi:hypothetical protein